ncbi:RNA pyrophosphohydrolase [Candidatus Spongiihabitans sp.]|uniref:RNA pyrophosphohydrolase n=1 Tax=Candidatus Spongiihabitans sp. TaxID=3101308 RepID=UPI003C7E5C6B
MQYHSQKQQIDQQGYRKNVGIIVCNNQHQVLWARRAKHDGWQFPQGGVERGESALDAAFRELHEEVGLASAHVKLLGSTENWLRYEVPYATKNQHYLTTKQFRGQKQRWFLFHLLAEESCVKLDIAKNPEFDRWRWVDYWRPLAEIVEFKRGVYKKALTELESLLPAAV